MEGPLLPVSMEVENNRTYIDQLYSNEPHKCLEAVREVKFLIIGNMREKGSIIEQGIVARLLQILRAPDSETSLKSEVIIVLNSLAKGTNEHSTALIQAGLLPALWEQLESCGGRNKYTELLLCCLRSIYRQGCVPPPPAWNPKLLTNLIQYGHSPQLNQECVALILAYACKTSEQQQQLVDSGAGELVAAMLSSSYSSVQLPALYCLSALCYENEKVSSILAGKIYGETSILDCTVKLMSRDNSHEMQLAAAVCLTYFHRANAIAADDPRILYKTLQCLVYLCRKQCLIFHRVEAAHTLAYLIEINTDLQRTAAITDHLIITMTEYLKFTNIPENNSGLSIPFIPLSPRKYDDLNKWPEYMLEASLKVYASLAANDEDIRTKIIEKDVMETLVASLSKSNFNVQIAAVRCLHSLSRSVQTLRTTFEDNKVWKPLMTVLKHSPCDELVSITSSTVCNLLLEFSPSKEHILDQGAVELLCSLTRRPHAAIRLNAVWALMNMAFQADHKVKVSILYHLGTDQIFRLLSDSDFHILMKILGLLRNLLSTRPHIDQIMQSHGKEIMQAVILILEGEHSPEVKEQALCILANIADGETAKAAIMSNEDVLKKLMNYMVIANPKLQIAATFCISNLIWNNEVGATERQNKLRDMGVDKILESMLNTFDTSLFDKVKCALNQFKPPNRSGIHYHLGQ